MQLNNLFDTKLLENLTRFSIATLVIWMNNFEHYNFNWNNKVCILNLTKFTLRWSNFFSNEKNEPAYQTLDNDCFHYSLNTNWQADLRKDMLKIFMFLVIVDKLGSRLAAGNLPILQINLKLFVLVLFLIIKIYF